MLLPAWGRSGPAAEDPDWVAITHAITAREANAIAGIPPNDWCECHIKLPETLDDDRIPWTYAA